MPIKTYRLTGISGKNLALIGFLGLMVMALITTLLVHLKGEQVIHFANRSLEIPFENSKTIESLHVDIAHGLMAIKDLANAHTTSEMNFAINNFNALYERISRSLDQLHDSDFNPKDLDEFRALMDTMAQTASKIQAHWDLAENKQAYDLTLQFEISENKKVHVILEKLNKQNAELLNKARLETNRATEHLLEFVGIATLLYLFGGVLVIIVAYFLIRREESLLKNEKEYLKLLFDRSPHAIYLIKNSAAIVDANDTAVRMTGFSKSELTSKKVFDLDAQFLSIEDCEALWGAVQLNEVNTFESQHRRKTGEIIDVEITFSIFYRNDDKLILSQVKDITESKKNRELLHQKDLLYRRLVETAPAVLYDYDLKKKCGIFYSPQIEKLFGQSADYMIANPSTWGDAIHPEDRELVSDAIKKFEGGGSFHLEYRIQNSDGGWRWIDDRSINHGSQSHTISGMVIDITDQKNIELQLAALNRHLSLVIEKMPGAVFSRFCDEDCQFQFLSEFFEKISGYRNDELLKVDLVHSDDKRMIYTKIREAFDQQKIYEINYRIITKDGSICWVHEIGEFESYERVKENKIFGMIFDISRKVLFEEEKLHAAISAVDGERDRIAHELHDGLQQTLVSAFANFEMAKASLPADSKAFSLYSTGLDALQQSIGEVRSLSHSLLPKHVKDFGIIASMESMLANLPEKIRVSFSSNIKTRFDENLELNLYRICQEAVNNIIKHAQASSIYVSIHFSDNLLTLTIEDDGIGFDVSGIVDSMSGFGILSMKSRASGISANFELSSHPGKGTFILIEVPINTNNRHDQNPIS